MRKKDFKSGIWIPVQSGLPEEGECVFVVYTTEDRLTNFGQCERYRDKGRASVWRDETHDKELSNVIYWMRIPMYPDQVSA